MSVCQRLLLGWVLLISFSAQATEPLTIESLAIDLPRVDFLKLLEQPLQQQLSRFQRNPDALVPFTSDGCSGGLSVGWQLVSEALSPVAGDLPQSPPWQHCCVTHDRAYWQGSAENGSALRLFADQQLKTCVLATDSQAIMGTADQQSIKPGIDLQIRQQFELQLQRLMPVVAELMYQAVRLGGLPCSGLPWRWGYGWPQCGVGQLYPQAPTE